MQNGAGVDVCTTQFERPVPQTHSFDVSSNVITIEFSQTMMNTNLTAMDLQLTVTGPNPPYSVTWSAQFDAKKLTVSFSPSPLLLGGSGEVVKLQLLNIEAFKSDKKIPMSAPLTLVFEVPEIPPSAATEAGGTGASYTFVFTLLMSVGISLLTGGSMELMWSLANTLQIIFFLGLLDLHYTSDLEFAYKMMGYSNFDNPATEYISKHIISVFHFVKSPVNTKFSDLGFSSTNMIANSLDKLLMILLFLLAVMLFGFLYIMTRKRESKLAKFIRKIGKEIK